MEYNWAETPEGRRMLALDQERTERYLTERTPAEMQGDLDQLANERLGLAETLEARAAEYRQEAQGLIDQAEAMDV